MTSVSKWALTKEDEDVSLPIVSSAFKRTKYMSEIDVNKVKNVNKKLKIKRNNKYTKNLRKIEDRDIFKNTWVLLKYIMYQESYL